MLSPTNYHRYRWLTIQAIAGYGCIDPSGKVADVSDTAVELQGQRKRPHSSIPATSAPTREVFVAISVSLQVVSSRELPARQLRNSVRRRKAPLVQVCLRSPVAQVVRLAQTGLYTTLLWEGLNQLQRIVPSMCLLVRHQLCSVQMLLHGCCYANQKLPP